MLAAGPDVTAQFVSAGPRGPVHVPQGRSHQVRVSSSTDELLCSGFQRLRLFPCRRQIHPKKQSLNAYVVFKEEGGVTKALAR